MQILLLSVLGIFLYDIEINNFPAYMWVVVLISLLVTSWGVAISVFAKTENTGLVMTNVIALGTAVVCGLWTLMINYQAIFKLLECSFLSTGRIKG